MRRISLFSALLLLPTLGCASETSEAVEPARDLAQVATQADAAAPRGLSAPISGTWNGTPFTGVLTVTRFAVENGAVVALGTLSQVTGELPAEAIAALTGEILRLPVGLPTGAAADAGAADAGPRCNVLALLLQPLNLDLLGAVVDLDEVDLDITAVPGAGNLLGNLLCSVAGLLDPNGLLSGLTDSVLGPLLDGLNGLVGGALGPLGGALGPLGGGLLDGGAPLGN